MKTNKSLDVRTDVVNNREPEENYIAKSNKPILNSRENWLDAAIKRDLPIEAAIRGTGLPVEYVMRQYGLNPLENQELTTKLKKIKEF